QMSSDPAAGMHSSVDVLRGIGSPADLRARAAQYGRSLSRKKVNAHIHLPPNFSAFDSVEEAIESASREKIEVLGTSNYYVFSAYREFIDRASALGIFPLLGLEAIVSTDGTPYQNEKINDPGNPGKMYVCGKGITKYEMPSPAAIQVLDSIRRAD